MVRKPVQKKSSNRSYTTHIGVGIIVVIVALVGYVYLPDMMAVSYENEDHEEVEGIEDRVDENPQDVVVQENAEALAFEALRTSGDIEPLYLPAPHSLKAIYMTQCVVGTPSFRADLVKLIDETELNAVVIDVKDFSGGLAFKPQDPALYEYESDRCGARDMKAFVRFLSDKGIYTIARITVFQDPLYTTRHPDQAVKKASNPSVNWEDHKGLNFIDVSAKPYWEHLIKLSRETYALGFDELNYDYIRFPSDGPMKDIYFPWSKDMDKQEALERFFKYLHEEMTDEDAYPSGVPVPILSADLFGMTTTNTDDLNIGQVLERALPYFDYIAPMVYPSHYPDGAFGFSDPNQHPYEIIHRAMSGGVARTIATKTVVKTLDGEPIYEIVVIPPTSSTTATTTEQTFTGFYTKPAYDKLKLRPWLQDFDYGGDYDVAEVKAQIQATYDVGLTSWMLWAPSNRYTRGALLDAE